MKPERLTKLRNEKKKTQQQIAEFLGITRPAYTAYESGSRKPDYAILEKIADYFDVSTDYLLGRTNDRTPIESREDQDPEIAQLLSQIKQKGAELEATALLRTASKMNKEQLQDILKVFEMIEKD